MSSEVNDNFEEKLERLEIIVNSLEEGDAPLDKSLELFEEGIKKLRECNKMLEEAEQKVSVLVENNELNLDEFKVDK